MSADSLTRSDLGRALAELRWGPRRRDRLAYRRVELLAELRRVDEQLATADEQRQLSPDDAAGRAVVSGGADGLGAAGDRGKAVTG